MDLRTQTSLIAAALSIAVATSVLLRARKRRVHWLFGVFGASIGLWYLSTFLLRLLEGESWQRMNLVCAVLVPLSAVQFFRAFIAEDSPRMSALNRAAFGIAAGILVAIFTPFYEHPLVATTIFVYVFVFVGASLVELVARSRNATSRFESARLRYLALVGALAAVFTIADYLPYVGLDIPPVGTVLVLVFLYVLSQSIVRYRLIDLYELAGRLGVLTALSFTLAGILWVLVYFAEGRFFLFAVVAALAVLLLFDPLRTKVEDQIAQVFFRERYDLEQTALHLRRRLAHVLELEDLTRVLVAGLEGSRRVTHASVYLVDVDMRGYDLAGHVGPDPIRRVEIVPARPLIDRLLRDGAVVRENVERELDERRELGEDREAETMYEVLQTLDAMQASVCVAIRAETDDLYGLLCVRDERLRDAYSPEEVQLFRGLAAQAAIAVENSRLYERMKERDRLAALGEMAAGLAHEIRNPLGAIKASAQYLADSEPQANAAEFLDIIVEEVDRLNHVVSSFLDYARPSRGDPAATDVNAAIERTMQLLGPECTSDGVSYRLALGSDIPRVRVDVELLRQVLINLVQNAVQAMESGGVLVLETATRDRLDVEGRTRRTVEIRVSDTGPGIPQRVLANLFVPFVTTKDRGTGLGLAISQRVVTAAGGHIEARTERGVGTTFVVCLPAVEEPPPKVTAEPAAVGREPGSAPQSERSSERTSTAPPEPPGADAVSAAPERSRLSPSEDSAGDRERRVATTR